jgi:hypothetical protein
MVEHKEKFSIGYIYLAFAVGVVFTGSFLSYTGGYHRPSTVPVQGAGPPPAPISILDAEKLYNIEILHPTVRELQEHINRHGGLKGKFIKVDNWNGDETKEAAKWLRCNQEAVNMFSRMGEKE